MSGKKIETDKSRGTRGTPRQRLDSAEKTKIKKAQNGQGKAVGKRFKKLSASLTAQRTNKNRLSTDFQETKLELAQLRRKNALWRKRRKRPHKPPINDNLKKSSHRDHMSRGELYHYHHAQGTLAIYYQLYGMPQP